MKQSRRIGSRFFMLLVFLFLYLPIFVLIVFSFNASKSRSVWSGFTLDWYKELFQNSMILDALWVTLAVSILAAVISTIIGTAAAIGFTCSYKGWLKVGRRSDRSLWTVDLEMPNFWAADRTVARFSMMYWAIWQARSSMFPFTLATTPRSWRLVGVYAPFFSFMKGDRS